MEAKEARKLFKKYAPIMNGVYLEIANACLMGKRDFYKSHIPYDTEQDLIMLGYKVERLDHNAFKISW